MHKLRVIDQSHRRHSKRNSTEKADGALTVRIDIAETASSNGTWKGSSGLDVRNASERSILRFSKSDR